MNIPKAIEINADNLSIEALEALKAWRLDDVGERLLLLPSETTD